MGAQREAVTFGMVATHHAKVMQGQVQLSGWISECVYCHPYLFVYFMPSSSTWANFRSVLWPALEEADRVMTRAFGVAQLLAPCEKFRMWKCMGSLGPPICLFDVLQIGGRIVHSCGKKASVTSCVQWWVLFTIFL